MIKTEAANVVNSVAKDSMDINTSLLAHNSNKSEQLMLKPEPRNWPVRCCRDLTQFNRGFRPNIGNNSSGYFIGGDPNHYRSECPKAQVLTGVAAAEDFKEPVEAAEAEPVATLTAKPNDRWGIKG